MVLKQAEEALPNSSREIAGCILREKVEMLLSQAYERAGLLAGALNACKIVHVECMKSRALLLLRSNYPNEAAPILKELTAIDKSWVDQVHVEQRSKVAPPVTSLLDLGPAALDLVLLQMERWGLFRSKCFSNRLIRTCKTMKDMAAKFIDRRVKVVEGQDFSFDGMLKCGSLTVEKPYRSQTGQPTPSFPFGQVEARHLTLKEAKFPANSEIMRIKGLTSLHLEQCENVRLDLTGIEELTVSSCKFTQVTGSLKSLRRLTVSGLNHRDPFILYLQAKKPKLIKLKLGWVHANLFTALQQQITSVPSLTIRFNWVQMEEFISNPELWKNVRDLGVMVDNTMNIELWTTFMSNLINCRGLSVKGFQGRELPAIWPPRLAYLKLSGSMRVGKGPTKRGAKGQVVQPRCVHIKGDDVFGFKLTDSVKFLILEKFTRKRHGIFPKDVQKLQVIVIGNKGLNPENKALIPPENVTSGLMRGQTVNDLSQWWLYWEGRGISHYIPWGLSKRK